MALIVGDRLLHHYEFVVFTYLLFGLSAIVIWIVVIASEVTTVWRDGNVHRLLMLIFILICDMMLILITEYAYYKHDRFGTECFDYIVNYC